MPVLHSLKTVSTTTWSEGVWEIVNSPTENSFLITDHPVTLYNRKLLPGSKDCKYPYDAPLGFLGTRTLFPLDFKRLLIITHRPFALEPNSCNPLEIRPNIRSHGKALFHTGSIIKGRQLNIEDLARINLILKTRARRYIATVKKDCLYPERIVMNKLWDSFESALIPDSTKVKNIKNIMTVYKDGRKEIVNQFGEIVSDPSVISDMEKASERFRMRKLKNSINTVQ